MLETGRHVLEPRNGPAASTMNACVCAARGEFRVQLPQQTIGAGHTHSGVIF
jgi:hypothetical protein